MSELFVNIALNLPIDKLFTYKVPDHFAEMVQPGKRVLVNFGKKTLTGIIAEVAANSLLQNPKQIISIIDEERILNDEILEFCKWISGYYIAPPGEALFSAIPGSINIKSETYYSLNENYRKIIDGSRLKDEIYFDIIDLFKNKRLNKLTISQIEKKLKSKNLKGLIVKLNETGILESESSFSRPVAEKIIKIIKGNFIMEELEQVIIKNKIKSEKQKLLLQKLSEAGEEEMNTLLKSSGLSVSSLNSLYKKNLICITETRKMRESDEIFTEEEKEISLTEDQNICLKKIKAAVNSKSFKAFLLHGVTGSGKTEIYINSIKEVLNTGKSAIVMVPEISLTPQLIHRFKRNFTEKIGIIHSKISEGEKLDTLEEIKSGRIKIVIGARSAIFTPLRNLGIIIVDEEHDSSYKQENSPKYHGRDAAVYRAMMNSAVVLLGTATPSFESYQNTINEKFELLELMERATSINMPDIKIIDLLRKDKTFLKEDKQDFIDMISKVKVRFLSNELIFEIGKRLEKNENVIILQNRRGYHAYLECQKCGNVEMCSRCNIALTYHKVIDTMKCHYCGFTKKYSKICSSCGNTFLIPMGAGTEKVEEELTKIFPKAVIKRMDSDVLTSKKIYQQILKDFYDKKIDILTGTQIISKGLDFPEVTLVGVINADIGLLNPDFRATEKTFQILTQVSGRSGRSSKKGEVLIQTNHSDFGVFEKIRNHDFKGFFETEIRFREQLNYPPFSRLTIIESKSIDRNLAESKIKELYNLLKKIDIEKKLEVLPPNIPIFSKLKDKYRFHILIKSKKITDPSGKYLTGILREVKNYYIENIPKKVIVTIDVDAVNVM